jgi:hypothetical protein
MPLPAIRKNSARPNLEGGFSDVNVRTVDRMLFTTINNGGGRKVVVPRPTLTSTLSIKGGGERAHQSCGRIL